MKRDRLHIDMRSLKSYNTLKLKEKNVVSQSKQDVCQLDLIALVIALISPILIPLSQNFSGSLYIDGFNRVGNIHYQVMLN